MFNIAFTVVVSYWSQMSCTKYEIFWRRLTTTYFLPIATIIHVSDCLCITVLFDRLWFEQEIQKWNLEPFLIILSKNVYIGPQALLTLNSSKGHFVYNTHDPHACMGETKWLCIVNMLPTFTWIFATVYVHYIMRVGGGLSEHLTERLK